MRGLLFAKQYPNDVEPVRGSFVRAQVLATASTVEWEAIVPVPWVPAFAARAIRRPHIRGSKIDEGVRVTWAPYPVLPRRRLYGSVGSVMARFARSAFDAAVSRLAPQFVHAHALYPSGAAALRLSRAAGLPLIVTVHGSDLHTNLEVRSWRRELGHVVSGAAHIVCVSSELADTLRSEFGAEEGRISIIPNTFDDTRFFPGADARRDDGPLSIISVGRLSPEKGFDVLIEALSRLTDGGPTAHLTLVGSGPEGDRLAEMVRERRLEDRVRLVGNLGGDDLAEAYREADMLVLPSRREGFGVVLIEAMASGLPVVATRSGGPADVVGPYDGILVTPDDPDALARGIASLASDIGSYDPLAIASRARDRFAPPAIAERLSAVYAAVVGGSVDV